MKINNIRKCQELYFELISSYQEIISSEQVTQKQIAMFIDEIQSFWIEKKEVLTIELDNLTSNYDCFMLCGAIYLDIEDNEHYAFKSLGSEHIISDPFLKLEVFFRCPTDLFHNESIAIFKRAYLDTYKILSKYQDLFYVLPIEQLVINNELEHSNLLNQFFISFVNSILNEHFKEIQEFFYKYKSFNDIQDKVSDLFKINFMFSNNDNNLSIQQKCELYIEQNNTLKKLMQGRTQPEIFIACLQSYIWQTMDILTVSAATGIIPFIRNKQTFSCLLIVMHAFIENEFFRTTLEKTIIFYIFYNSYDKSKSCLVTFDEYIKIIKEQDLLELIIDKIHSAKIDIFKSVWPEVATIIEDIFSSVINKISAAY